MKIGSTSMELLDQFFDGLKDKGLLLPDFSLNDQIVIFSDYAGERSQDKFYSYSFYIIDNVTFHHIAKNVGSLRGEQPHWKDNSFFEYKRLRKDNLRRRILQKYLDIFDQFDGLVVTFLINQDSPDYFLKVSDKDVDFIEKAGLGSWKVPILQKSANILSILSFLVKRFLNDKATFIWYSDRDDIFGAEQRKVEMTLDMLTQFLNVHDVNIGDRKFSFISDKHTSVDSDFMSITDLSAGAVLDYYQIAYSGGEIKDWTKAIIAWMSTNSTRLKKLIIVGQEREGNSQLVSLLNYGLANGR